MIVTFGCVHYCIGKIALWFLTSPSYLCVVRDAFLLTLPPSCAPTDPNRVRRAERLGRLSGVGGDDGGGASPRAGGGGDGDEPADAFGVLAAMNAEVSANVVDFFNLVLGIPSRFPTWRCAHVLLQLRLMESHLVVISCSRTIVSRHNGGERQVLVGGGGSAGGSDLQLSP